MKKTLLNLFVFCLLVTPIAAHAQRVFDNFDTARGVQVFTPMIIPVVEPKVKSKKLVKKTVQQRMRIRFRLSELCRAQKTKQWHFQVYRRIRI